MVKDEKLLILVRFKKPQRAQRTQRKSNNSLCFSVCSVVDFSFESLQAAVTALPGGDGRSWGGAFARGGVMRMEGFGAEGVAGAVSLIAEGTETMVLCASV